MGQNENLVFVFTSCSVATSNFKFYLILLSREVMNDQTVSVQISTDKVVIIDYTNLSETSNSQILALDDSFVIYAPKVVVVCYIKYNFLTLGD